MKKLMITLVLALFTLTAHATEFKGQAAATPRYNAERPQLTSYDEFTPIIEQITPEEAQIQIENIRKNRAIDNEATFRPLTDTPAMTK